MVDEEVGREDDPRRGRDRLFVGDAGDRDPARHPRSLGEQNPAEDVEDAAGDVAREHRLPPGDLRPSGADPVAEEAQDQVPAERAQHEEDGQDGEGRDQPDDVEVDALLLDLRPLVDDREDEEAEDQQRDPELNASRSRLFPGGRVPNRAPASPMRCRSGWLALHEQRTLVAGVRTAVRAPMATMGMGEFELLARLRERLPPAGPRVQLGSGDDAAVTVPGGATATSVDALVDGVHFRRDRGEPAADRRARPWPRRSPTWPRWAPRRVRPTSCSASPPTSTRTAASSCSTGCAALAAETGTTLAGGDLTRAPALTLAVTVVGHAAEPESSSPAPGARPATPSSSPASWAARRPAGAPGDPTSPRPSRPTADRLPARQLEPVPRLAAGRALAAAGATAMIDLSDGLGGDARHLADASGVGLRIDADALPLADGVAEVGRRRGRDPLRAGRLRRRGLRAAGGDPARGPRPGGARLRRRAAADPDRRGGRRRGGRDQAARGRSLEPAGMTSLVEPLRARRRAARARHGG